MWSVYESASFTAAKDENYFTGLVNRGQLLKLDFRGLLH